MVTTIPLTIIILISLFATGITTNSYCDQQHSHTTMNDIAFKTCCDINALFLLTKPSAVYQMWQSQCGGKWSTTSAFCDTKTADGGWTVIQRRKDGSVDFNRPWSDYEKGFGDLNGEFWYGLKNMNCLTQTGQWELRVDFEFENKTRSYLHYNVFKVGSATAEYPLTIRRFTGITPTDPFSKVSHSGMKFSTYDNDNDQGSGNCAAQIHGAIDNGGWWYNNKNGECWRINLNAKYKSPWTMDIGGWYSPGWIEMKIRPLNCTPQ